MPAEVNFEALLGKIEAVKGTAETTPDHYLNLAGTVDPQETLYEPTDSDGTLEGLSRSKRVREWNSFSGEGGLDTQVLPWWLTMIANGAVSAPTTPAGATLARLWTHNPNIVSNALKTATLWFGDPNVQELRAAYAYPTTLTITANGDGTDGTKMKIDGMAQKETKVTTPAFPSQIVGPLIVPNEFQVWIDAVGVNPIGTTLTQGEVISAVHTIPVGYGDPKFIPGGPGSSRTYSRAGLGKRIPTTDVVFEVLDFSRYDQWNAETLVGVRVRHNGPLIETVSSVPIYHYVEVDMWGPWRAFKWGTFAGTNRTIQLQLKGHKQAAGGASYAIKVMNTRTTL